MNSQEILARIENVQSVCVTFTWDAVKNTSGQERKHERDNCIPQLQCELIKLTYATTIYVWA